jgi:hypothetical protein
MQDSLGGNAKTLMFVNCSPSIYNKDETKNSLEYAKRVREIKNNPMQNIESKALSKAKLELASQSNLISELMGALGESDKVNMLKDIIQKQS